MIQVSVRELESDARDPEPASPELAANRTSPEVAKSTPLTDVRRHIIAAHAPQQHKECHTAEWLRGLGAGKNESVPFIRIFGGAPKRLHLIKNCDRSGTQWHAMLAMRLDALGGHSQTF